MKNRTSLEVYCLYPSEYNVVIIFEVPCDDLFTNDIYLFWVYCNVKFAASRATNSKYNLSYQNNKKKIFLFNYRNKNKINTTFLEYRNL